MRANKVSIIAVFATVSAGILVSFQNCSNVRLYTPDAPAVVQSNAGSFPIVPPKVIKLNKMLFVVDKSGSNAGGGGNDPDNAKRAVSMETFLELKKDDPFYRWGFIAFGPEGNKAKAYINETGVNTAGGIGVFGNADDMKAALELHRSVPDEGCTPYMAALQLAQATIEKDIEDFPDEEATYNVFFMSDGFPNDANQVSSCGDGKVKDDPNDPYIVAVKNLRKPAPDRIFLSTAYYAQEARDPDRAAAVGLRAMSEYGGGKFVDLRGNGIINFDEIKTGAIPVPLVVKRMFVVNLNSGFCEDGRVGPDSDADGICDQDEKNYNVKYAATLEKLGKKFDPVNRNSLESDYADSFIFKYQVLPFGAGLTRCNIKEPDMDFDLLNTCEEFLMQDTAANGPTPQWTAAMPKGGSERKNPDSDGDGFLDGLEWMSFGLISAAVNYQSMFQPFAGGLLGEEIIREHRHPKNPLFYGPDQYDGNLVYTGTDDDGNNTYRYDQRQLALYRTLPVAADKVSSIPFLAHEADENVIMVYYIAVKEDDPNGRGMLYYSFQKFKYQDASLSAGIKFDQFKLYEIPKKPNE